MPRVSVIIPTYLRPHFLVDALASVRAQTLTDFEVLVCDNGADPATERVVGELADDRLRYVPRPENLGMLRNAMLGFADARSPLVMKLDDDDALQPDALQRLVEPLESHPEIRLSFGGVLLVDEHGAVLEEETARLDRTSGRGSFAEGPVTGASGVVARGGVQFAGAVTRADLVDWRAVPDAVATAYDFYLTLAAAADRRSLWFTPSPVVRYRLHAEADTRKHLAAQARATVHVLDEALASGRHADTAALRRRLAEATLVAGRALLQQGSTEDARPLLRRSLRLGPSITASRTALAAHLPPGVLSRVVQARARLSAGRSASSPAP